LQAAIESLEKDWDAYQRQAVAFHLRNARSWGNTSAGADLARQIDDGFSLTGAASALVRARLMQAA
jgi:CO dehydrogenase maturation factor